LDRGLSSWLDGWWATPGGVQLEKTREKSLENVILIIPSISVVSLFQVKSARDVFKVQGMLLLLALNTSLKDFWKH